MGIAAGLSATKTGFDLARSLIEIFKREDLDPGDIQARLLELQALILDAQRALSDAEEQNRKLRRQIEEFENDKRLECTLLFAENVYLRQETDGTFTGPFCPSCWDHDRKLVRMISGATKNWLDSPETLTRFECRQHKLFLYLRPEIFRERGIG